MDKHLKDNPTYTEKKQSLAKVLTIIGRKPVQEALQDPSLNLFKLHLADSNKPDGTMRDILRLAEQRQVPIAYHDKKALSRISKNGKQDQGVALDIQCSAFQSDTEFLLNLPKNFTLLALDRVTNPQNVGMIIRSVAASPTTALVLPEKGCARLDALVIKASAGTLFKCPLIRCGDLLTTLERFKDAGATIVGLDAQGNALADFTEPDRTVYVLGNETEGLSPQTKALCTNTVGIPMANSVESLNVGVTASLIAFKSILAPS